jgi:hypothetical protein
MEILTSVKRLYIRFKSPVNEDVYGFGRAAILLLVEVWNHTVPVRERGRIRVKKCVISNQVLLSSSNLLCPLSSSSAHINTSAQCHPLPIYVTQWRRGLRLGSAAARLLGLWVRLPPKVWMSVCCECCMLTGRVFCDGPITRPESPAECGVSECDREPSILRRSWSTEGCCARGGEDISFLCDLKAPLLPINLMSTP